MTTPDPATLSWLLRKASLDVWHARLALDAVKGPGSWTVVSAALEQLEWLECRQHWLADIIREHGQEGTE